MMKILLCVDGSEYSQRMLDYVLANRQWLVKSNELTALHAVPVLPPRAAILWDKKDLLRDQREAAKRVLDPVRAFCTENGIDCAFVSEAGEPADVIANRAKREEMDLIIIGSHGHGKLAGLVMGSVVTKVLAKCNVPALIIR